jgi:hypothetical protein
MAIYEVNISAVVFVEADDESHAMDIVKYSIGDGSVCKTESLRELTDGGDAPAEVI